ncbi:hypothetical protein HOO65_080216 [Ceratocystis lukuohia]|uniref:Cyclin N-terminal domain-containing protein n=2 Tax=Ceratocystis TaxID=5157 RepID=A0A2C5X459_9PEZI|nr:hypothetical protein CFIMG_002308RA [Ceratocystis fimbriata CBS 114723]
MRRSTRFQDEDDESYDSYVTYRPLSRLPTPPPCWKDSSADFCHAVEGEQLKPSLLGPATHLVNLIPVGASLATPSVPLVQAILTRASLPLETIALAVCILDSLDSKFALNWRLSCPLQPPTTPTSPSPTTLSYSKRHTLPATPPSESSSLHIDCINPILIVLAALAISVKFVEDPALSSTYFITKFGNHMWTSDQLNATERCVMENLNYRIMPLYSEDLLAEAMVDMQLAARPLPPRRSPMAPSSGLSRQHEVQAQPQTTPSWARCHGSSASVSVSSGLQY